MTLQSKRYTGVSAPAGLHPVGNATQLCELLQAARSHDAGV